MYFLLLKSKGSDGGGGGSYLWIFVFWRNGIKIIIIDRFIATEKYTLKILYDMGFIIIYI